VQRLEPEIEALDGYRLAMKRNRCASSKPGPRELIGDFEPRAIGCACGDIASLDLFVVRTISFKLLYGLVDRASRPQATSRDQRHYHSDCRVDRWAGD
jgi:hypothetical protein